MIFLTGFVMAGTAFLLAMFSGLMVFELSRPVKIVAGCVLLAGVFLMWLGGMVWLFRTFA